MREVDHVVCRTSTMKSCGVKKVLVINRRKPCSTARKDVASHWQHEPEVCAILGTATVMTNKVLVSQVIASSGDDIKTNLRNIVIWQAVQHCFWELYRKDQSA